ncbi:MAG: VWA-like domain-containing protein [Gemmataceae bacterium]
MTGDDPFAALEQAAARQSAQEAALKALAQARCRLVLGKDARSAFFATLALRLTPEVDWSLETMATDGRRLFLNPGFVRNLPGDELLGVVAHEVLHNALGHHARRGCRDRKRWNVACDLAVNPLLLDGGFTLPGSRLMPGEGEYRDIPRGLSAEEYYDLLPRWRAGSGAAEGEGPSDSQEPEQGEGQGEGDRNNDPGRCGGVRDPGDGSPSSARQSEAEWKVAVAQAHQVAQQRGQLPGGLARLVQEVLQPGVDWRDVLRDFLSRHARNDFSWSHPNRRFIHQGLYLPGMRSEELGEVVLAVDTSGSIGRKELARFAAEAQGILESFDCSLVILYHDAAVLKVQTWRSGDGPLVLEPVGGGGTSHVCVFEHVEALDEWPVCVVCLTDLYTDFPTSPPDIPTLWAVVGANAAQPPFGMRVEIAG